MDIRVICTYLGSHLRGNLDVRQKAAHTTLENGGQYQYPPMIAIAIESGYNVTDSQELEVGTQ